MVSLKQNYYSPIDLQVILEALHIYDSAYQALLNTYAIRWFLKEVDKKGNLPENRLIELQNNFKRKIDAFGEIVDKLDEKLIERDDQGFECLGANFAVFRMKLPESIDKFNEKYTNFIDTIKLDIE